MLYPKRYIKLIFFKPKDRIFEAPPAASDLVFSSVEIQGLKIDDNI